MSKLGKLLRLHDMEELQIRARDRKDEPAAAPPMSHAINLAQWNEAMAAHAGRLPWYARPIRRMLAILAWLEKRAA